MPGPHGPDPTALPLSLPSESLASANVVLDYRGSVTRGDLLVIKDILNDVAARVADVSVPLGEAAALGRARFAAAFPPEELAAIAASYRASIRFVAPKPQPPTASGGGGGGPDGATVAVVATVVAVVGVAVVVGVAACVAWQVVRVRRRGRRLRGSLAPGVGGETSLVLTDVVDSAR